MDEMSISLDPQTFSLAMAAHRNCHRKNIVVEYIGQATV